MSQDVVIIKDNHKEEYNQLTTSPKSLIEALSAIQEQSFIDSTRDDPESYSKSFALINRLHFFWAGFSGGIFDVFLTIIGVFLFSLSLHGAIPLFGRYEHQTIDIIFGLLMAVFPYLATFCLFIVIYNQISGTISRIMALWLSLGFWSGTVVSSTLYFLFGHYISYDFSDKIYSLLLSYKFYDFASFFWDVLKPVFIKSSWREFVIANAGGFFVFLVFIAKDLELRFKKKRSQLTS